MATILVADDDLALRQTMRAVLRKAGYSVLLAQDGIEAVELFERHADDVSLVVLDLVMPRMGGREARERITATRPATRFLFISGSRGTGGSSTFIEEERLSFLPKPFDAQLLLGHVHSVLAQ